MDKDKRKSQRQHYTDLSGVKSGSHPVYRSQQPTRPAPAVQPKNESEPLNQTEAEKPKEKKRKKTRAKKGGKPVLKVLVGILLVGVLATPGIVFWRLYVNETNKASTEPGAEQTSESSEELTKAQIDELLVDINKLYILPTDESPVVATITDAEERKKDQPFYKNSENGDIVLLYSTNKLAIIYSPSRDVIVNSGLLTASGDTPVDSSSVEGSTTDTSEAEASQE